MNQYFPHLLSPIRIGQQVYANRLEVAPMGGVEFTEDGQLWRERVYEGIDSRVSCGAAAFLLGETAVSETGGRGPHTYYGFRDLSPEHLAPYKEVSDYIHSFGCKVLIELCHVGEAKEDPGMPTWGPMEYTKANGIHIHGMTEADIAQCCADFADAAWFMKQAGYDGVLLHAGHGWLFHQFLSSRTNQRTDHYGGSIENRSRFSVEVMRAIREKCGKDFIIEARISGSEHAEGGYSVEEVCQYAKYISEYLDLIHVSAGLYRDPMRTWQESTMYAPHACNADIAAQIKQAVSIPVSVVGGINSPEQAEALIASGQVDLIALGRELKADPLWLKKAEQGRPEEIRRCLRCMRCFPGPFEEAMKELNGVFPEGCTINPAAKHPEALQPEQAAEKKRVLIAGGGAAGLQAAITAAQRGHSVVLVERTSRLGGILNYAEFDPVKKDLFQFARTLEATARRLGVEIRTSTECSQELLEEIRPDAVILAAGSSQALPPIQGLDGPTVIDAMQAEQPGQPLGEHIVVLGGGLVGCETAVSLARAGKQVHLIEMRDRLAQDAYRLHRHQLLDLMDEWVPYDLNTACIAVSEHAVQVQKADGSCASIPADTVINALGRKANPVSELQAMCQARGIPGAVIGDCAAPRKLFDAVEEGYLAAAQI